jgi:hypothetical protein
VALNSSPDKTPDTPTDRDELVLNCDIRLGYELSSTGPGLEVLSASHLDLNEPEG